MSTFDVALVGGGPRSTALLAALGCAARRDGRRRWVAVIDSLPDGAGTVWRHDQSSSLLANSVVSQVAVGGFPTLGDWGGADLAADAFPSRRAVGAYLRAAAGAIDEAIGPGIRVERISAMVRAAVQDGDHWRLELAGSTRRTVRADAVVVATGSGCPPMVATDPDGATRPLDAVPAGADVFVAGLGLSFHDAVSVLTEDRGGTYRSHDRGRRYLRSGREPRIMATSRSGLPVPPKAVGSAADPYHPDPLEQAELAAFRAPDGDLRAAIMTALRRRLLDRGVGAARLAAMSSDGIDIADWVAGRAFESATADAREFAQTVERTVDDFVAAVPALSARQLGALEAVGARLTSGPPPERFHKLEALLRAGVVRILPPDTSPGAAWSIRAYAPAPTPPFPLCRRDGTGWPLDPDGRILVRSGDNRCPGEMPPLAVLGEAASFPLGGGLPGPASRARLAAESDAVIAGLLAPMAPP
ncbi:FAD/NAD(P)-binding protein [Microbacteriaceae bacterium VKM Ac-2854]|nr:FAD/NAD(P)-binding protein [Microbacteriaceae bacterium VKM Ac-2854]